MKGKIVPIDLYPASSYRGPRLRPCSHCLAPLKPSAGYCFNCGAPTSALDHGRSTDERLVDTVSGIYCPLCGTFNDFHNTFRCLGCWESVLCREHMPKQNVYLCSRCWQAREEGRLWDDMEEAERCRAEDYLEQEKNRMDAQRITPFGPSDVSLHKSTDSPPPDGMAWVSGGEFLMGDDQRPVYVDTFAIDLFPVTNLDFQRFLPQHRFDPEKAHHPLVQTCWYEAAAFARWAGKRLPTEAEWEKAARGTDGRLYPWGERFDAGRCNTLEGQLKDTTPVDRYPTGRSPYGCFDMAGNVLEWTADWYDPERNFKVVKVCARIDHELLARCANRAGLEPVHRYGLIGLRCVW